MGLFSTLSGRGIISFQPFCRLWTSMCACTMTSTETVSHHRANAISTSSYQFRNFIYIYGLHPLPLWKFLDSPLHLSLQILTREPATDDNDHTIILPLKFKLNLVREVTHHSMRNSDAKVMTWNKEQVSNPIHVANTQHHILLYEVGDCAKSIFSGLLVFDVRDHAIFHWTLHSVN